MGLGRGRFGKATLKTKTPLLIFLLHFSVFSRYALLRFACNELGWIGSWVAGGSGWLLMGWDWPDSNRDLCKMMARLQA